MAIQFLFYKNQLVKRKPRPRPDGPVGLQNLRTAVLRPIDPIAETGAIAFIPLNFVL